MSSKGFSRKVLLAPAAQTTWGDGLGVNPPARGISQKEVRCGKAASASKGGAPLPHLCRCHYAANMVTARRAKVVPSRRCEAAENPRHHVM